MATEHIYDYQTTLDGKPEKVTFTIVRDTAAEKAAGRHLWPITATVGEKSLRYVVAAGTRLRESRSVLPDLARDGFITREREIEPFGGFGSYDPTT
jgi:hypothetical protein